LRRKARSGKFKATKAPGKKDPGKALKEEKK